MQRANAAVKVFLQCGHIPYTAAHLHLKAAFRRHTGKEGRVDPPPGFGAVQIHHMDPAAPAAAKERAVSSGSRRHLVRGGEIPLYQAHALAVVNVDRGKYNHR